MSIDDRRQAFEQQYLEEDEKTPVGLAIFTAKFAFPQAGFPFEIFSKVFERLNRATIKERITAMWRLLVKEFENVDAQLSEIRETKVDADDLAEAIQLAIRRDSEEFNDNKRARYVSLIGGAVKSETEVKDLAVFIQTIEQLGEGDIAVLKVLNSVMNKPTDWNDQRGGSHMNLHPNTFIERARELDYEIAIALGQSPPGESLLKPYFDHEPGYEVCARLQGFGLAHELPLSAREVPVGDYCFRPSNRGLMLLRLLGEDVPNFDRYFPKSSSHADWKTSLKPTSIPSSRLRDGRQTAGV